VPGSSFPRYSLDEGVTWETARFNEFPMDVYNIRVEPDNAALKFIVQGIEPGIGEGLVVAVDFSKVSSYRFCRPEDYEFWSP
jgi:hypothetical protein